MRLAALLIVSLQVLLHLRRQRQREAQRRGDLLHRRFTDCLQRAELAQQGALALRPDTRYGVEGALHARLRPYLAVVLDGEAVGLVADALDEVEGLGGAGQDDRLRQRSEERRVGKECRL